MKKLIFSFVLLCLIFKSVISSAQACLSLSDDRPSGSYRLFSAIGNNQIDIYLSTDVRALRTFFQVAPSYFYFSDSPNAENALTFPVSEQNVYPDGTIIFGINLFRDEWAKARNLTTIPLIIAHEFGHAVDFKYGAIASGSAVIQKELFADFMAGIFLHYRAQVTPTDLNGVLRSFFSHGEYDFTNPQHHGTPEQRVNAISAGYNWYGNRSSNSVDDMISSGQDYIKNTLGYSRAGAGRASSNAGYSTRPGNLSYNLNLSTSMTSRVLSDGTTSYVYKVVVSNGNNVNVRVTVGGLKYGYYRNCDANPDNYVTEGDFDERTITVKANDSENAYLTMKLPSYPPNRCAGVLSAQRAKVIDVEKDQ